MSKVRRVRWRGFLALWVVVSLFGCGDDGAVAPPPSQEVTGPSTVEAEAEVAQGGTLVIARAADTSTLDPSLVIEGESIKVTDQIFEGLVRFGPGSTDIEPALAVRWESSDDGLEWTFHLRRGVTFHDGTPFDAEAVKFSIERQLVEDHPDASGGVSPVWSSMFDGTVESVTAVDSHTVRITLSKPSAPILTGFAVYTMSIVSPTAIRTHGAEWANRNGVGTGPFVFEEWISGERFVLRANESYWGGRPNLDRVEFRIMPNVSDRVDALESGEAQVAENLDSTAVHRLARSDGFRVQKRPGLNVAYLALNTTRPPFDDVRVRQAVSYAIEMQARVRATYRDLGVPAKNFLPPVSWGYNSSVASYEHDTDRARELLAEVGLPDGFSFTLDVMANSRPYLPEPVEFAEGIKADLASVGIEMEIRVNEWQDHIDRLIRDTSADYDAALLGWVGDIPDPSDFLYSQFHSTNADLSGAHHNISLYSNAEVDDRLDRAQVATGQEERARLYREVQTILREDVPVIPIAHSFMILAHDEAVRDISVPVALSNYGLEEAWIAPEADGGAPNQEGDSP